MSRAMNLQTTPENARQRCAELGVSISSLEPLISGGVRLVLLNSIGAAKLRKEFRSNIITSPVVRTRWVANR